PAVAAIAGGTPADDAARAAIGGTLTRGASSPRERLIRALIDPTTTDDERAAAEAAYTADITARYQADTAKLQSTEGLAELDDRRAKRQQAAQALFARPANPLPRMQHVPPIFLPSPGEGSP